MGTCVEAELSAGTQEEAAVVVAAEVQGMPLVFSSLISTIVDFFKRLVCGRGRGE